MGNDLAIGLQLSVIGLFITFLALGLLILVMNLLQRIFPVKKSALPEPAVESTVQSEEEERRLEEMAVALAVGISLLERQGAFIHRDPSLGKLLEGR